jgi:phytoene dehydrogenase-like protein
MKRSEYVVVGGGIAGLTAAAYLARAKKNTLLIEKNDTCGGLMNSFSRDGFHFDGGARALVNSGLVAPMAHELGIDVEFLPNPVSLGVEDHLFTVTGEDSLLEYSALLKKLYPGSAREVDALAVEIRGVINDLKVLYGVDNPLFSKSPKGLRTIPSVFAWLFKFFHTLSRMGRLNVPMEEFLGKILMHRPLRDVFSQHFFKGTPAFFTLSYFALYNDYLYPVGGVGAFTGRICAKIGELGGEVITGTEIARVVPGRRIVEDSRGNQYGYGKLIWAADLKRLYTIADTGDLPARTRARIEKEKEKILSSKGAESVFTVFLAVDEPPETYAAITSAHLFYTPSREGLGETFKAKLGSLLDNWHATGKAQVFGWLDEFCDLNTYEVSIPVLRDPALAPPGKSGIIISCLMDYELFVRIEEAGWYQEAKTRIEDRIIDIFSRTIFPSLKDKVISRFSASPLTLARRAGSSEGSLVGWSFERAIPVASSLLQMGSAVKTSFPGVFKAGKWAFSPAGGPTAIMTGRLAAKSASR